MVDPADVCDPFNIPTTLVDSAVTVHVDANGRAYVMLVEEQIQTDGSFTPILVARLSMSKDAMREIADRMQTATMVASYRSAKEIAEYHRKLT